MSSFRKPKGKAAAPSANALDAERRVLHERQRQIDEKIAALNRTIRESAPASYQLKGTTTRPGTPPTPPPAGKRYGEVRRPPKKVVLRAEKQEGRLQTFALSLVVLGLVLWALSRYL